jgi:uncharacterized OsmC-like protein
LDLFTYRIKIKKTKKKKKKKIIKHIHIFFEKKKKYIKRKRNKALQSGQEERTGYWCIKLMHL